MLYLLDTAICSYILKNKPEKVAKKFAQITKKHDTLCISVITYSEVFFGIKKKNLGSRFIRIFNDFISRLEVVDFDINAAKEYASIRTYLENKGTPIGNMDILIASSAKALNAVLVTNNIKHFKFIPHIKVENWV